MSLSHEEIAEIVRTTIEEKTGRQGAEVTEGHETDTVFTTSLETRKKINHSLRVQFWGHELANVENLQVQKRVVFADLKSGEVSLKEPESAPPGSNFVPSSRVSVNKTVKAIQAIINS